MYTDVAAVMARPGDRCELDGARQSRPTQELLEGPSGKPMSYWQLVWWRLRRDKVTLAAAAVILLIVLSAVLAPYLAPYDPFQGSIRKRLAMVGTPGHVLGTDEQGRDMLTRLLYGGRMSLVSGVTPVFIALLVGSTLGIIAGYVGGRAESADHARGGYLLRLSLHAAGHCHLWSPGGRVEEHDHRAVDRLYPTDHPRGGKHHHPGARLGIHGSGQGQWGRDACHHPAPYDRQRAGADFRVCQHPGQCQRHHCLWPELSGLGRVVPRTPNGG